MSDPSTDGRTRLGKLKRQLVTFASGIEPRERPHGRVGVE